jgi:hypothetical protein
MSICNVQMAYLIASDVTGVVNLFAIGIAAGFDGAEVNVGVTVGTDEAVVTTGFDDATAVGAVLDGGLETTERTLCGAFAAVLVATFVG